MIIIHDYLMGQEYRITGLGGFKEGDLLIIIMHTAVNAAARKTFATKLPFLFGST